MIVATAFSFILVFWGGYFSIVTLRGIKRCGLRRYARWCVVYDARTCVALLSVGLAVASWPVLGDSPSWLLGGMAVCLVKLVLGLAPPQILLLHTFDPRNYRFGQALAGAVTCNVVSLFPRGDEPRRLLGSILRTTYGIGARFSPHRLWRGMVQAYLEMADVVVVDLSHGRAGLLEELRMVSASPDLLAKVVFVQRDQKSALATVESGQDARDAQAPVFEYGRSLDWLARSPIDLWGPLGTEIGSKLPFQVPHWVPTAALPFLGVAVLLQWLMR